MGTDSATASGGAYLPPGAVGGPGGGLPGAPHLAGRNADVARVGGLVRAGRGAWGAAGQSTHAHRGGLWFPEYSFAPCFLPFHAYVKPKGAIGFNLLAGPNQGGKTFSAAREVLWHLRGEHPLKNVDRGEGELWWQIGYSAKQSLAVQRLVHATVPKHWTIGMDYNEDRGFLNRKLTIQHVSGDVSTLEFKTAGEDALGLASATLHGVWPDEPHLQEHHNELVARLLVKSGMFILSATMINRPVEYIRDMVSENIRDQRIAYSDIDGSELWENYRSGDWNYTRFVLHPENCWHLTREQIESIKQSYLPATIPQRVYGRWEGIDVERYIGGFDPGKHVVETWEAFNPNDPDWKYGIGIDHGERPGTQIFVLIAWKDLGHKILLYVLDERAPMETTNPQADAKLFLDLAESNGIDPFRLSAVIGDINSAGKAYAGASMNTVLASFVSKRIVSSMGLPADTVLAFQINTPEKAAGSVELGCRYLTWLFSKGWARVHPKCKRVRKTLAYWKNNGKEDDDSLKHAADALRYINTSAIGSAMVRWGIY